MKDEELLLEAKKAMNSDYAEVRKWAGIAAKLLEERMLPEVVPTDCSFDPTPLKGVAIGMFHCPECGDMVLAGMPHPGRIK